jgi:uncharacterized protein
VVKEISKLKLAITSSCTLRCTHCHIDKNSSKVLDLNKAIKAIDFFLSNAGEFKRLEIYGGEPFLEFEKIKSIIEKTEKLAQKKEKKLTIHIATNGTLINNDILTWIKKRNIYIAVSFSGTKESHNFNRIFKNGKGSWEIVLKNIKKLIEKIGNERIVILYCVHPSFLKNMLDDFKYIISLGIKIIDIECVHGTTWRKNDYIIFQKNIQEINKIIINLLYKGKFIFHEAFINYIINNNNKDTICPFYSDLEVYPDGNLGIMPYAFTDYEKTKNKIKVGEIKEKVIIKRKYLLCKPSEKCNICLQNYYDKFSFLKDGAIAYHNIREREIKLFFKELLKKSKDDKFIMRYIKNLVKLASKFYNSKPI